MLASWFSREFVDTGKLPLLICFLSFLVTFVLTRTITRMIRAGRGPFTNNVGAGGLHIHHVVPGIILLMLGAFLSVGINGVEPWESISGAVVGIGTSLVLDEFALVLRMQDVYWEQEGRLSVEMVGLTLACLGLAITTGSPFADDIAENGSLLSSFISIVVFHLLTSAVCAIKGKYKMALFGIFVPALAFVSSFRLARPGSRWARRSYADNPDKLARAQRRAARSDARWAPLTGWLSNTVAGKMSDDLAQEAPVTSST